MFTSRNRLSDIVALVMDERLNPLRRLPAAQRFQLMFFLSLMWTSVFCVALGSFLFWGQLVLGHALLLVGVAITSLTFRSAAEPVATSAAARSD